MNELRKLVVLGLNELLAQGKVTLAVPDDRNYQKDEGHIFCEIAGLPSVVQWSSINMGELRLTVWWDYNHSMHPQANASGNALERFRMPRPLAKRQHFQKFVGVTVSAWLERKTGKHLQGYGSENLFDVYQRRDMKEKLRNLPEPYPNGYAVEGQYFI